MWNRDVKSADTGMKDTPSMTYAALGSILLGLGVSLGFGLGGLHAMGDSWMQLNEVIGSYYTMTPVRQTSIHLTSVNVVLSFLRISH